VIKTAIRIDQDFLAFALHLFEVWTKAIKLAAGKR